MVKNFAHRGFSGLYPENTLLAFKMACETPGCNGIEMDVQLTRDGECVVIHDEKVDRTCHNVSGFVKDFTLAEIKTFDASYIYKDQYGFQGIPTLREYFDLVKDYDIVTNIELKTSIFEYPGIEQKVLDLINEYGLKDRIIISSFNHYTVKRMKELCPDMKCGLLTESWLLNVGEYLKGAGMDCFHPCFVSLNEETVADIKAQGVAINTWTVNEEGHIRWMVDLGVDSIIGNFPDRITKVINECKYQLDTKENKEFMEDIRNTLFRFGRNFPSPGGSSYYLGDDGTPWVERNRESYVTCRMVHVYSLAHMLGIENCEELIDAGLKGLHGELHDTANGGWYAGLTADGQFLPTKQCYAHAFVILAASSAVLVGRPGAQELLDEALATYDKFFWNEEEGLSSDTWNTEFTVMDDYRGLNANMHTVEAFLAAADVTGDEKYRIRAGRIIDHVAGWAKGNQYRIPEHFSKEWVADLNCNKEKPDDPFKPYGATPGHGLEWARLISQWATSTFEKAEDAAAYIDLAENLYARAVADAWNADGAPGICYTTDWDGTPVVRDRMHWTLAEGINTAAVLYRITGKQVYADGYAEFLKYLDETVLDHVNGSWFHQLNCNNEPIGTVWPGKADLYHAVQATLIPYYRVNYSIAPAVKETK